MKPYWNEACELLRILVYLVKALDPDGVDLFLANENKNIKSRKSSKLKEHALLKTPQSGSTSNLHECFSEYVEDYCNKFSLRYAMKKGLRFYILTKGDWLGDGPAAGMDQPIRSLLKLMEDRKIRRRLVGVQFIQFGRDPACTARLEYLDNLKRHDPTIER
jgi:hypothetical protein